MIHEVGRELEAALSAKGCPFVVVDGPERTKSTTYARERVVLEHDDAGDSFGAVQSQHKNPKLRRTRVQGLKLTIYARTPDAGALEFEHRRRAEHVLDLVLVAMDTVAIARRNTFTPTKGRFVIPDDLAGSEVISGAAYELTFTFDRGVADLTWAYAKRPEAAIGGVGGIDMQTTTRASMDADLTVSEIV